MKTISISERLKAYESNILVGFFLCMVLCNTCNAKFWNVTDFGAKGDGETDDSAAFLEAWKSVCKDTENSTLLISAEKTFLIQPIRFEGPCKSNSVNIKIEGTITAPQTPEEWQTKCPTYLILFEKIQGLIIDGQGKINGNGASWWGNMSITCVKPTNIFFNNCHNLQLSGISSVDSPRNHISLVGSSEVCISGISIVAPKHSPNTDGIDIADTRHTKIEHSTIGTGDDCIAIRGKTFDMNITDVTCGPGHGISIGSLGEKGSNDEVEEIHVRNCTFIETQNAARIKTWRGGFGFAKSISFEDIQVMDTQNPIIINQNYCDKMKPCPEKNSNNTNAVVITNIKFNGVRGTSTNKASIMLDCDEQVGCTGIVLENINLTSSANGKQLHSVCNNAHGTSNSCIPTVSCLIANGSDSSLTSPKESASYYETSTRHLHRFKPRSSPITK